MNAFKEPRGMLKFLEIVMAIIAFSTVCGYSQSILFDVPCNGSTIEESFPFSYPFDINVKIQIPMCDATIQTPFTFQGYFVSQSQFFVFNGVFTFCFCLFSCVVYLFYNDRLLENDKALISEFVITGVLVLFWFIGSIAWANAVINIKYETNPNQIFDKLKECSNNHCNLTQFALYGMLDVSIIAGFTCVLLWGANSWFLRRDMPWWRDRFKVESDPIVSES